MVSNYAQHMGNYCFKYKLGQAVAFKVFEALAQYAIYYHKKSKYYKQGFTDRGNTRYLEI